MLPALAAVTAIGFGSFRALGGVEVLDDVTNHWLGPQAVAALTRASLRPGAELSVAGYSYGGRLPAAVLTFGSLDAAEGLMGEPGRLRLVAPVMAGDMGGPVLDAMGGVVGVLIPAPDGPTTANKRPILLAVMLPLWG